MSSHSIGMREIYRQYRKENLNAPVLLPQFAKIVSGYGKFLTQKLLDGNTVSLPERMGQLEFLGRKVKPSLDENGQVKGLSVNWKATNELWNGCEECKERKDKIYYFNEHTHGIRYRLKWSKKKVFVSGKEYYSFKLSFSNRKLFKQAILDGGEWPVEKQIKFKRQLNVKS